MDNGFRRKLADFFGLRGWLSVSLTGLSFLLCLANAVLVFVFLVSRWGHLGFLRLHYTAALGIDWVDGWRWMLVFPGLAVLFFSANGYLSGYLARRHHRLGLMMSGLTVLVLAAVLAGGALAVSLN
ncbi:hypothetical protein JW899_01835 [Candidatus Uhrbacteria bacterium]|nr:hypothetical protein [Candidatus Uhrbacteria bacterium]